MDDFTSYESDPTRFFYEVFDENGVCENKFICIETVTNTGVGTNSDQTHTTIKIYSVPIYDHRHDTYIHRDDESFIADVWFVNASKSLTNKKYSHIDICKSNFTTLIDIFKSITYVNPAEIQTLVNKKLLLHSDHHFLPPGLTETELQNFIKSNWSQIYNKDYNYEFFHSSGANSGIMREVHNVKVEKNVVTNKYRYTTAGKSKANITPSTITVDSVNHTYTGTLSSSTYSGYKLAANNNKIVSSGNHTLTGYTGNNITLGITGNTVNVTNSKTSTTRTTELQNFIKSNIVDYTLTFRVEYAVANSIGYVSDTLLNGFGSHIIVVIYPSIASTITKVYFNTPYNADFFNSRQLIRVERYTSPDDTIPEYTYSNNSNNGIITSAENHSVRIFKEYVTFGTNGYVTLHTCYRLAFDNVDTRIKYASQKLFK